MTRLLNWAFLTAGSLLLLWLGDMLLLGSSFAWVNDAGAHATLTLIGRAGLRAFPVLFPTAVVLSVVRLWRWRIATRGVLRREH